jgi:hypothetical protein
MELPGSPDSAGEHTARELLGPVAEGPVDVSQVYQNATVQSLQHTPAMGLPPAPPPLGRGRGRPVLSAAQQRLLQVTAERRRAQAAANRRYLSNLTPERAADMRSRRAQAQRQSVRNDTPDEAVAHRQRHAETQRRHIANQSPTEAAARVEANRRAVQATADRQRAAAESLNFDVSFERDPDVALQKFIVDSGT